MVSDFLVSLASTSKSKNDPNMAKAVIKHFHGFEFPEVEDSTDNKRVRDVVKCVSKTFSKEKDGKGARHLFNPQQ